MPAVGDAVTAEGAIRVLVVDDSALVRQILTRALTGIPGVEVVGTAKDGVEAVERAVKLQPDVITLDIEMPELNGLEALPFLLKDTSARIIMLSSIDDPDVTYQALSSGATDFITKPKGGFASCIDELTETLVTKIGIAFNVPSEKRSMKSRGLGLLGGMLTRPVTVPQPKKESPRVATALQNVVAIAASTGGPPALEEVFAGLSADMPAAYLVVQHLPAGFASALARRLTRCGDVRVVEAEEGMPVRPGCAYLAPHGWHMTMTGKRSPRILLEDSAPLHGLRPAADPLMSSVARTFGDKCIGVVLTGMGSDGLLGMERITAAGGMTIAQDEETSTVWGMPGSAVKAGAAKTVVPIDRVAAEIRRAIRGGGGR